jgi:MFS family permease
MSSNENAELPLRRKIWFAIFGCLQNSMVGGMLYGWACIDRSILSASTANGGAGLTLSQTTLMFSWASCAAMVSTLALGIVLDRYGPRVCSVLAHAIIALGCQVFAMSNRFETFALAVCLISLGGPGIQVSIVHLANLFPDNQYLVLSCLNGTISISFAVFAMFDWLWEKYPNVGFRSLFGYYALVVLVSLVASAIYWPDEPFEAPEKEYDPLEFLEPTPEEDYFEATTAHRHLLEQPLDSYLRADINPQLVRHNSYRASKKALDRGDEALISLKDQPFWRQFCSGTYFRTVLFFVTVCFLANFYVASFSTEMADSRNFSYESQRDLARIFTLIMAAGVLASLVVGVLMDRIGLDACTALTLLLGQGQILILVFVPDHRRWMIFGFVVYVFFRQFLFPVYIANLTAHLGFKYFGLLNGLGFAASGIAQVFMASLVQVVQGDCNMVSTDPGEDTQTVDCEIGRWMDLHVVEFVLMGLLLLAPWIESREKLRRQERIQELLRIASQTSMSYGSVSPSPSNLDDHARVGMEL